MSYVFVEENGIYSIDCTNAVWATDKIHADYQKAGIHIKDVDFLIETDSHLIMVEYKNADIPGVKKPEAFRPMEEKKILDVWRKFYDSLHYLRLLDKTKPVQYVYILEYPNGDETARKRLRNRLKLELPFVLQENIGKGVKLIDKVDVVSIKEWNENADYGMYPMMPVVSEGNT